MLLAGCLKKSSCCVLYVGADDVNHPPSQSLSQATEASPWGRLVVGGNDDNDVCGPMGRQRLSLNGALATPPARPLELDVLATADLANPNINPSSFLLPGGHYMAGRNSLSRQSLVGKTLD